MLGQLPQSVSVCGKEYEIRSDFRDILTIIAAYNDDELTDQEKVYVCLQRFYRNLEDLPVDEKTYSEAIKAAHEFIECNLTDNGPSPKVVNWEKDEQMIFPAINKVAGMEVRAASYMHWWTFLGFFMSIDRDDLWGTVLTIRQKKATHKKLEKWEKEFLNQNPELCALDSLDSFEAPENDLRKMYKQLLMEGGAGDASKA